MFNTSSNSITNLYKIIKGENLMLTIRELEIIKAALEGDIIQQKDNIHKDHPAWKHWLDDSEKLLKKVSMKLAEQKAKEQLINNIKK
jgi:hypothetical protein